jgi:hypothetical protein
MTSGTGAERIEKVTKFCVLAPLIVPRVAFGVFGGAISILRRWVAKQYIGDYAYLELSQLFRGKEQLV